MHEPAEARRRGPLEAGAAPAPEADPRLRARLVQLAWFRYRIPTEPAEDVVQRAVITYLEVRERYGDEGRSPALLVGIFHKKCLEHVDRSVRERRRLDAYARSADAARENPWIDPRRAATVPSTLEQVVRREDGRLILQAIAQLRPMSRQLVDKIVRDGLGRKELIEHFGLNRNTLDSRLHDCRNELRGLLEKRGISFGPGRGRRF